MPNYSVAPVSSPMDFSLEKLIAQATLASKQFEGNSPEWLYRRGIAMSMQGCQASALGMLFLLRNDEGQQGTVRKFLTHVSSSNQRIFEKALAAV